MCVRKFIMPTKKIIGILEVNYEAPIELREKLNFHSTEFSSLIIDMKKEKLLYESFFMCTCNRSMMVFVSQEDLMTESILVVRSLFEKWSGIMIQDKYLKSYIGENALNKLMRLATGCDSAILGEDQILAQIKLFYSIGLREKTTGNILNRVVQSLLHFAKKIRQVHVLSTGGASIPGLVSKEVRNTFQEIGKPLDILMIGWGPMSYTIFKIINSFETRHKITVTNRTLENVQVEAKKIPIAEVGNFAHCYDVIISMTSRMGYVIKPNMFKNDNKKRVMIDLGVPRNIDPTVANLELIRLINIDDLNKISDITIKNRRMITDAVQSTTEFLSFQRKMLLFMSDYGSNLKKYEIVRSVFQKYIESNAAYLSSLDVKKKKKVLISINKRLYRSLNNLNAPLV